MNLKHLAILILVVLVFATGYAFREQIGLASVWKTTGLSTATVNKSPTDRYTENLVGHWTFDGKDITTSSSRFSTGFNYRRKITVDNTKVSGSGNFTNFPMLVSVQDGTLSATSTGGHMEHLSAFDLAFYSASGTKLDHEIESYATTTGSLVAWVEVPTLNYNVDTVLYMHYGSSTISTTQEDITGTWNTDFVGVWHLSEDPSGTAPQMLDSTSNNHDGTTLGTMTSADQQSGQINGALNFENADDDGVEISDTNALDLTSEYTISAWINPRGWGQNNEARVVDKGGAGGASDGWHMGINDTSGACTGAPEAYRFMHNVSDASKLCGTDGSIVLDQWQMISGTYSSGTIDGYVDGVFDAQKTGASDPTANTDPVRIGIRATDLLREFDGIIDEVWIMNTATSSDWLLTVYRNHNSPNTFYTLGQEEGVVQATDLSNEADHGTAYAMISTPGKHGQALKFGGFDQYVDVGAGYNGVKSVSFWLRASTSTSSQSILQLNGSAHISATGGFLSATGFTSPNIYVDGVLSSEIATSTWHQIIVTTETGINASDIDVGRVGSTYFGGEIDDVRLYSAVLTLDEIVGICKAGTATVNLTPKNRLTSGLVGHWTFDGPDMVTNVADISGSGYNGQLQNQNPTTTVIGRLGQALSFDGTNDSVSLGSGTSLLRNVAGASVSVWVKTDLSNDDDRIIFDVANGTDGFSRFELILTSLASNGNIQAGGRSTDAEGFQSVTTTDTPITANTWHFITAVIDYANDDIKIYTDGVERSISGTPAFSASATADTDPVSVLIGMDTPNDDNNFDGTIDEVRVYSRALSANEVLELFNMGR